MSGEAITGNARFNKRVIEHDTEQRTHVIKQRHAPFKLKYEQWDDDTPEEYALSWPATHEVGRVALATEYLFDELEMDEFYIATVDGTITNMDEYKSHDDVLYVSSDRLPDDIGIIPMTEVEIANSEDGFSFWWGITPGSEQAKAEILVDPCYRLALTSGWMRTVVKLTVNEGLKLEEGAVERLTQGFQSELLELTRSIGR